MDRSGRMALLLSQYRREDDWRQADEERRARREPEQTRAFSASKRLFVLIAAAIFSLATLAPSVAASPRSGDLPLD